MNIIKSLIFLIVLPGAVMVYVPYYLISLKVHLFFPYINGFRFLGFVPMSLGMYLIVLCFWDFINIGKGTPSPTDPPENLVEKGLYRLTRNPMYVAVGLVLLGEILIFESTLLLIYTVLILLGFHLFIVFYEEPTLRRKFGSSYVKYIYSVPRWLPGINGIKYYLKNKDI